MKLLQLSANNESFKTVNFNPKGLTVILGAIGNPNSSNSHTYNGVGKSLIIELVHFCLGSNPNKSFAELLPNWEFSLLITNNGKENLVRRSTNSQNTMILDGRELTLEAFKTEMQKICFNLDFSFENLTFRSLLDRFVRRNLSDYIDPLKLSSDFSDYVTLLKTSFLLGIDLQLIYKKYKLKTELTRIRTFSKNFREDTLIRDFFLKNKDEEIELKFLEERIKKLESDRDEFKVADNYHSIEKQANELKEQIAYLRNQSIISRNSIEAIEKSMFVRTDIPAKKLINAYQELLSSFKAGTVQKLELVEQFHNTLIKNRMARLSQEKIKLVSRLTDQENNLRTMHSDLDNLISYLGANKALDELISISNQIAVLQEKAQKIRDYQSLNRQYKIDSAAIKSSMNNEVALAYEYLDETKDEFELNIDSVYRDYVKRFYPNSPAGISVRNDDRDNQTRFDIDVKIENQASDGINHVRIFCFDLLILISGFNHHIDFIFHDSRLYDGVDPRQRVEMLRLANQLCIQEDKQYIVTLNEDHIDSMTSYLIDDEIESLITNNVTLRLSDESDSSKLLGIQIDMKY